MTPFERILLDHDEELLYSAPNKDEFITLSTKICNIAYVFKASINAIFHHKLLLQNTIDRAKCARSASFISGIRSCILQFAEL
jgi:hypothetical protein